MPHAAGRSKMSIWVISDFIGGTFSHSKLLLVWIPPSLARFAQGTELPREPPLLHFHIVLVCKHVFIESSMLAIDITARYVRLNIMLNAVAVMKYGRLNASRTQALLLVITWAPRATLSIHQIPRTVVPALLRP